MSMAIEPLERVVAGAADRGSPGRLVDSGFFVKGAIARLVIALTFVPPAFSAQSTSGTHKPLPPRAEQAQRFLARRGLRPGQSRTANANAQPRVVATAQATSNTAIWS